MKDYFFYILAFFSTLFSAHAQIQLKDGDTDYIEANRGFQNTFYEIRMIECGGFTLLPMSNLVQYPKNWYSCSDTLVKLYLGSTTMKVEIQPGGPVCFGIAFPEIIKTDSLFLSIQINAWFESKFELDSIQLNISLTSDSGISTGLIQVYRNKDSGSNRAVIQLDPVFKQAGHKKPGKIRYINFEVQTPGEKENSFWGAVHFQNVRID